MTTTETIVRASATILNITTLHAGDVYKRLEKATSYAREKLVIGRVLSVMHNGTEAALTALESTVASSDAPTIVAHGVGADLALFTCEPAEWVAHMADVRTTQRRKIERLESDLDDARRVMATIEEQIALPATAPATETLAERDARVAAEARAAASTETPTA